MAFAIGFYKLETNEVEIAEKLMFEAVFILGTSTHFFSPFRHLPHAFHRASPFDLPFVFFLFIFLRWNSSSKFKI